MDNTNLSQHISKQYSDDLEGIRNRVLIMGGLVEQQISDAVEALLSGNTELGEKVIVRDYQVNALEVSIDEKCTQCLALRQPAAGDLRLIMAIIKTITDLERIGDQAEKVARMALRLAERGHHSQCYSEIQSLGQHVKEMLYTALNAFARLDVNTSVDVAQQNLTIDQEYEAVLRQHITFMMADHSLITRSLDVIWAARALERIGEHAKNISNTTAMVTTPGEKQAGFTSRLT